ncbi:MAG TPA: LrgB family protein [Steroidobacteraceae bacterium]|nr:LrgB family protein [Steroidobacteraceae bacterium]
MPNVGLPNVAGIWVYLSGSPLFALTLTLCAYQIGLLAHERFGRHPLANPVAIAVLIVAATISAIQMPYSKYFEGAQFVHFLLGTATVSLAVPVYHGLSALRGRVLALAAALAAGAVTSVVSAVVIAHLLGADRFISGGLYAKSLTTPIAMGVAERIGASPTLTAVYALITGLLGAVLGRYVLDLVGCRVWWQRGFVIGIAAHGIGTSRAFAVHPEAGAYASLAMGLHGICAAVLLPWIVGSV